MQLRAYLHFTGFPKSLQLDTPPGVPTQFFQHVGLLLPRTLD
jgi:hypothetical protein